MLYSARRLFFLYIKNVQNCIVVDICFNEIKRNETHSKKLLSH